MVTTGITGGPLAPLGSQTKRRLGRFPNPKRTSTSPHPRQQELKSQAARFAETAMPLYAQAGCEAAGV